MRINIVGGTGYTGANIASVAATRGHQVTSFSRNLPPEQIPGVTYRTGSVFDDDFLRESVSDADVVVLATSPRGELEDVQVDLYSKYAGLAAAAGVRLFVIGGYSALRPEPGAARIAEADVPAAYAKEIRSGVDNLETLLAAPESLDWVYVSPAGGYGSFAPGEATGHYRKGGEVALVDDNGDSMISGADFALGVVDAIEEGTDHRAHISFAY